MKKTLVIGASTNSHRYSFRAIHKLRAAGHDVVAVGRKPGNVLDVDITEEYPSTIHDIHTISLYLRPDLQSMYYDQILKTNPKRIIFNPGTENLELEALARNKNIETLEACTLVMLSINDY